MTLTRRFAALGLTAVCTLPACTSADATDEPTEQACGEAPSAAPGELRTILRASTFDDDASLDTALALPDGSVVVSYDTNPDEAGDSDNLAGEKEEPGLVVLREDGSCAPFRLPTVDGRRVTPAAEPLSVDGEGLLYLWDPGASRLVRGTPGGAWEHVVDIADRLAYTPFPAVAVGPDGEVFVGGDFVVSRVIDGALEVVAGTGEDARGPGNRPPDLGDFPREATGQPLPHINDIAAAPSGGVLLTVDSAILELDPSGTLRVFADAETTAGQEGAIRPLRDGVGSRLGQLVVTPTGDVIVDDYGPVHRIRDGVSTVLVDDPVAVVWPGSLVADGSGLLVGVREGNGNLAVYGLPEA